MGRSLRQDSNPHLGRTTGACLPLTLRRRTEWRCRESNPILLGASEALSRLSFIPEAMCPGGVEPPQREASAFQAGELAGAQRPREGVAGRTRTGVAGITTRSNRRYTTATAGTAGLEPAPSRLTSERSGRLSYAPIEVARVGFEPTVSSS